MGRLFITVLFFAILGWIYHLRQNKNPQMGGKISIPKTFWLFFALYCYYIVPLHFLLEGSFNPFWTPVLLSILVINYSRLAIQGLAMYRFKIWRPIYGMTWNLVSVILVMMIMAWNFEHREVIWNAPGQIVFLLLYLGLLLTDTYYAHTFKGIVGQITTGDQPVWFANGKDTRFAKINRITYRNNVFFSLVFISMVILRYALF